MKIVVVKMLENGSFGVS